MCKRVAKGGGGGGGQREGWGTNPSGQFIFGPCSSQQQNMKPHCQLTGYLQYCKLLHARIELNPLFMLRTGVGTGWCMRKMEDRGKNSYV